MSKIISTLFQIAQKFRKIYWKIFDVKTYGIRVIFVKDNKVLLVRHRYNPLWVFPGGGMKEGEDVFESAQKECREEVGINLINYSSILGWYKNIKEGKNDLVTVIIAKDWDEKIKELNLFEKILRKIEIKDLRWFDLESLPNTTSGATLRRIEEYQRGNKEIREKW